MKLFKIAVAAAVLLGAACSLEAQVPFAWYPPQGLSAVSVGTTNGNTALSWAIVPAKSANGGTPAVTALQASSDLAFAAVYAYQITTNTTANYASSTTSIPVAQTNGFTVNDVILIRHLADENYEKRVLTTFTSATNLTTTVAPMEALNIGDIVYRCTTNGAPYVNFGSTATTNLTLTSTQPIMVGQRGMPLLVEVAATTKGTIGTVTAVYLP